MGRWATGYQPTNQQYFFLYAFAVLQPIPKVSAAETDPIRKSGKRVVQLGVIAPDTVDEVWSGRSLLIVATAALQRH